MRVGKFIVIISVAVFLISSLVVSQSVPYFINYQGRLMDKNTGQPLDGVTVALTFKFYGVESGQTPLFLTVQQTNVQVTGGLYNVLIGSGTITPGDESTLAGVFQKHKNVWMGVAVDSDSEMTPRARIASVPYALIAEGVDLDHFYNAIENDPDHDGDGYKSLIVGGDDCNEVSTSVYPGAAELCDCIDNQCPGDPGYGQIDEGCYTDGDGDGYYESVVCGLPADCSDSDPDNWFSCATCQDLDGDTYYTGCDAYVNRNGPDQCDDNEFAWNASTCTTCIDGDSDSWRGVCDDLNGYFDGLNPDCNDGNSSINPGASEICDDLIDNDCDDLTDGDDPECGLTWWTVNSLHASLGLNQGIAGVVDTIAVTGVEAWDPWGNYDAPADSTLNFGVVYSGGSWANVANLLNNPPYIPVLKIMAGASPYDLSSSAGWVQMVDNLGNTMDIKLPGDLIPANETLLLYVAENGSTFYMYDNAGDHSIDFAVYWECEFASFGCPTMTPPTAFANPPAACW